MSAHFPRERSAKAALRKRFLPAQGVLYGGGQVSDIDIGAFLNRDREHPERQAFV
jgi:hypothetical protein